MKKITLSYWEDLDGDDKSEYQIDSRTLLLDKDNKRIAWYII